ncbi:hypothetical protein KEM56_001356 [Ascosphaera pollenicola]|nr:hypothetical protein KEM56_001356 [Ascosphaera pollenicola]
MGFLISLKFISENSMYSYDAACVAQGWMIQVGDPLSGLFVLAIALHTVLTVATGRRLPHRVFVAIVIGLWVLVISLALIPMLSHKRETIKPSGSWRKVKHSRDLGQLTGSTINRIKRVTLYMVIYPIAYVSLSLPLAAARMADARNREWSSTYHCVAGCVMACSGWVNVLLYALTRRSLVLASNEPLKGESGYARNKKHASARPAKHPFSKITERNLGGLMDTDSKLFATTDTTSTGDDERGPHRHSTVLGDYELGSFNEVMQQTTIEIRSEPAPHAYHGNHSSFDPLGSLK